MVEPRMVLRWRPALCLTLAVVLGGCGSRTGLDPRGPDGGGERCTFHGDCEDGLVCNGTELCVGGVCERGTPPACDDMDPCTSDNCDDAVGGCYWEESAPDDDFDSSRAAYCGGDDCDDSDPSIYPGAPEVCNGLDDDCDGEVDEMPPATRITDLVPSEGSFGHSMVWTGSRFVVAWHHRRAEINPLRLVFLSPTGELMGDPVAVAPELPSRDLLTPALAWTGEVLALAWNRSDEEMGRHEISVAVVTEEGELIDRTTPATHESVELMSPGLHWADDRFGLVYRLGDFGSGYSQLYYVPLDPSGWAMSEPVELTAPEIEAYAPSLIWTGTQFMLAHFMDHSGFFEVGLMRLSPEGDVLGWGVSLAAAEGFPYSLTIVRAESEYLVAWSELRMVSTGEMRFIRVSPEGSPLAPDGPLTDHHDNSTRPALAWTGEVMGMAWTHYPGGMVTPGVAAQLRFSTMNSRGGLLSEMHILSADQFRGFHPELLWTGNHFGLLWTGEDEGQEALYFVPICAPR